MGSVFLRPKPRRFYQLQHSVVMAIFLLAMFSRCPGLLVPFSPSDCIIPLWSLSEVNTGFVGQHNTDGMLPLAQKLMETASYTACLRLIYTLTKNGSKF